MNTQRSGKIRDLLYMSAGYFGREEFPYYRTKVHVVFKGMPICNSAVKGSFHFCSNALYLGYVECKHCRKIVEGLSL